MAPVADIFACCATPSPKLRVEKAVSPSGIIHAAKSGTGSGTSTPRCWPPSSSLPRRTSSASMPPSLSHWLLSPSGSPPVCTAQCRTEAIHRIPRSRGYYGVKQSRNKSKEIHVIALIHRHFFDLISFISLTVKNLFLVHFCCTFVTRNKIIFITLTSEKPEWGHKIETNKSI